MNITWKKRCDTNLFAFANLVPTGPLDTQENRTVGTADCRVQGFKHERKRRGWGVREAETNKAKQIKPLAASLAHRVHTEQNKEELEKAELEPKLWARPSRGDLPIRRSCGLSSSSEK
ncbi:unnamed protein product [Pleuronectes platessa]|uniref:Uncharacterized protein n=1 Tax=Pleuronectes platessa TaxID=8262 RepID=A0A9N7TXG4_PLEPL|nr:unnamed protein product [Pleuronectes platessa]